MNDIINRLQDHRSVRKYDPEKDVSREQIKEIVTAAMAAPNWINGQQVTVIEIRDKAKKTKLASAAGNQGWIEEAPVFLVFCMDFYRAKLAAEKKGKQFQIVKDIEAVLIGSTDVGIALGTAVAAAESMGLGTVPIGGIRRNSQLVVDLLDLPEYVFPIAGLVVGYPKDIPGKKPRLPLQATFHQEKYEAEIQRKLIDDYDEVHSHYISERTGGREQADWSGKTAKFFDSGFEQYRKSSSKILKQQGFHYE